MGVIFVAMARIHSLLKSGSLTRRLYATKERRFISVPTPTDTTNGRVLIIQ
jgi:hypothetical protein